MRRRGILLPALLALAQTRAPARDLQSSRHNLSISGPGPVLAGSESQPCLFCHTPHNASPAVPLWNHKTSLESYSTYASSTMKAANPVGQPSGSSKLCLSCHDGTVALGQTVNDGLIAMLNTGPLGRMPAGPSNIGVDLTDDHPVSFQPSPANTETMAPPAGDPVEYDARGEVQCTSCHDAHKEETDPVTRRFLVKSNQASGICATCHRPAFWDTSPSAHKTSARLYTQAQGAHTGYSTVRDNACESCHRPHSGSQPQRLLKFVEELTCGACHNGSVTANNIVAEFNKAYSHPTFASTPSSHDAAESPTNPITPLPEINPGARRHAECFDCHNPHAANGASASTPNAPGPLRGVWGIDSAGSRVSPAPYEHQICYKCHADSANKPQESGLPNPPYTARQIVQFNVRLEFEPTNPSHHAVEAPGRNGDVPSLLSPYTTASLIYCGDCHSNDTGFGAGGGGPKGPHGSRFNHLLERNLNVGDNNTGSNFGTMYALCFKCHSQTSILNDVTFGEHRKHIDGENASCMVCHDPHGVSGTQGSGAANSHLINFDTTIVLPNSAGQLRFEDRGNRAGACYLRCHGRDHNPETY